MKLKIFNLDTDRSKLVKSYAGTEAAVCVSFAKKEILEGQLDDVRELSIESGSHGIQDDHQQRSA